MNTSLIVLNYNGQVHLKEYFDSVYKQTLLPDEVIMMDNASTDNSVLFVKANYPQVKIIENSFNAGTALGSNIAFRHAQGHLVIFQSNDMRLDKDCIKNLVKTLIKDNSLGIVTSILLQHKKFIEEKKQIIDNAGGISDVYGLGMQKYPSEELKQVPDQSEVFFSYGGSFIIRRKLFEKIGGFDPRYFTLNDDIDLSWRVRLQGKKIIYIKSSLIYHKVSATLGPLFERSTKRYWSERNAMRTLLKNHDLTHLLVFFPVYLGLLAAEMGFFLSRGRINLFWADFRAIVWNIFYLPETLVMRYKIQNQRQPNHIYDLLTKKSYKLKLFNSFRKVI